ncbi:Isonitrile hydratase-like protein xanA [Cladobotryum mycophilum]|uniref:Isonitrile hydratase-like protein xanA n=1 Tax=Cladobotryum mycophilum TaxID=491253 RepID=A0ABR0T1J3_9HYPO
MSAHKSSAVADEPIDVLIALHPKFDLLDFAGPLEVFSQALHDPSDETSKAFEVTIVGAESQVLSAQGAIVNSQITYKEAHERLEDFDILVILGGNTAEIIEKELEPLGLITDFSELQKKDPARERTVLSVCTGSHLLAKEGILAGLSATTHHDHLTTFENLCSDAAVKYMTERTDVVEDARYVVNNLRFDIADEDQSPYTRRKSDAGVPKHARKGSMSFKESNRRPLYLVSALVDDKTAEDVAKLIQWTWTKGVVVDGLDV